ncbi:MAG: OTU domain-containing protein [Geminicoccaceae bacterium]
MRTEKIAGDGDCLLRCLVRSQVQSLGIALDKAEEDKAVLDMRLRMAGWMQTNKQDLAAHWSAGELPSAKSERQSMNAQDFIADMQKHIEDTESWIGNEGMKNKDEIAEIDEDLAWAEQMKRDIERDLLS